MHCFNFKQSAYTGFVYHSAFIDMCGTLFSAALNVSILVTYNPPSDFTLSTPPYYRPASSATFTCVTQGAAYPVSYHWSSTSTSSFVRNQITQSVTKTILTSADAGVHTCTVTDADGNTGHSSTEMKMIGECSHFILYVYVCIYVCSILSLSTLGAGIYVEHSQYISHTSVSDNTAIKLSCDNCQLTFFCYSNLTTVYNYPTILFPSGTRVSSYSSSYSKIRVQRVNSYGIRLDYVYRRYSNSPTGGIYTCQFSSSKGQVLELSIGIYFHQTGQLRC